MRLESHRNFALAAACPGGTSADRPARAGGHGRAVPRAAVVGERLQLRLGRLVDPEGAGLDLASRAQRLGSGGSRSSAWR